MLKDWDGFLAEFLEAGMENVEIFVVLAFASILQDFGFFEAVLDICFANIQDDGGFDFVSSAGSYGHYLVFFTLPATDGRKDERIMKEVFALKIGENPFVEQVGGDKVAATGEILAGFFFHSTDNHAG